MLYREGSRSPTAALPLRRRMRIYSLREPKWRRTARHKVKQSYIIFYTQTLFISIESFINMDYF